ncbi:MULTISPECIES: acyltransferase [unclassified Nocardia]|uniref:acyltransferase family protein n=1 Tax=unclassified Nocardia TaxID=2637762 RepID=UPI001CE453F0|nr:MULTISPECIES: acyltransferase [unclassified Nocardia]
MRERQVTHEPAAEPWGRAAASDGKAMGQTAAAANGAAPTETAAVTATTKSAAVQCTAASEITVADPRRVRPALPSLTGARWWAAFAVFILHSLVFLPVYPFQKSEFFRRLHYWFPMQLGAAGVTFFFVLSGFIIYWSYKPGMTVRLFYRRRVLKIYPTHLLAAAVFIAAAGPPLARTVVWLPDLLLIHNWVPKWTTVGGLNVPSWSLTSEMLFYLSFPLMLPLVRRIPARLLLPAAGVLMLGILAMHTAYFLWVPGPKGIANAFAPRLVPGELSPHFELHAAPIWFAQPDIPVAQSYWLSYNFPASRLPEFFLGVLAARMVLEGRWHNTRLAPPLLALFLAYAATWVVPVNYKMSALLLAPTTAVVATLAARDLDGRRGLNSSPTLVWLGNISYAFYLIQFPVMVIVTRTLIGGGRYGFGGWAGFATLCLAVSVTAAAAIYHWVDVPIMRRFARKRPAPLEIGRREP